MTLTSVRLLGRHLTADNHQAVLAKAKGRSRQQIDALVAELAPQPDAPSLVRKLPTFTAMSPSSEALAATGGTSETAPATAPPTAALVPTPRPIVRPTAPERYRMQFTIGPESHEMLPPSGPSPPRDPGWRSRRDPTGEKQMKSGAVDMDDIGSSFSAAC